MKNYGVNYFLGANSPVGFVSLFDELYSPEKGERCFIIKGGPGTGKSTFMKEIADEIERHGFEVHRIHCSSDPNSLDGIKCEELKVSVADGTSPHVIEPLYPGAVENIINLGDAWDESILSANRDKIISTAKANSAFHARSVRFLRIASILLSDNRRICENAVYEKKAALYVDRFIKRNLKPTGEYGHEKKVFLSAVTPDGVVFYNDTVKHFADTVIEIDDSVGLAASYVTGNMKKAALKSGADVICGYCPLDPTGEPEHIIIPKISVAFIRRHKEYGDISATRTIHARRFVNSELISLQKQRIAFNKKVADEMISEAVTSLRQAKAIHDELERIYISAMDFDKLANMKGKFVGKMVG